MFRRKEETGTRRDLLAVEYLRQMNGQKRNVIYFGVLGTFSCGSTEEERTRNASLLGKLGKKAMSFLQYMVVNHGRNISTEELIEEFWGDNSANPSSSLRNMLFKVRGLLKAMFPELEGMLVTLPECYAWSPEIRLEIDAERMENLCLKAKQVRGEEQCSLLGQAVSCYNGDFLSGNDAHWAKTRRQYYETLYLDACKAVLPLYYKTEQWMEIVSVCSRGYEVDFTIEDFTAYQMQALIALGQAEQAVEKYKAFRTRMLQEYNIPPAERVERLHTLATGLGKNGVDEEEIFRLVCEGEENSQAFFCTFTTFQSIVALERRHLTRSGQTSSLVIISMGREAVPTTDGRRLERVLLENLRTGDPIARLEAGSYILMLTGSDEESARLVISRIDSAFHRTYRHSAAKLTYSVADLRSRSLRHGK